MKKKILAILLAVTMSLSVFASASVAGDNVALPEAEVTLLPVDELRENNEVDLTFGLNFKSKEATEAQLDAYGDWYADFVLTLSEDVTFSAENPEADGYLAGQYDAWSDNWVLVPVDFTGTNSGTLSFAANEEIKIMETAAEVMDRPGLKYTYAQVYEFVKDFDCGLYLKDAYLHEHPDLQISLELRIYNNEDEAEYEVIGGETYEFAPVERPTAVATEIDVEELTAVELTYGLSFEAVSPTEEQLNAYGDWYADFVFTINKDAMLSESAEGADGYLAGFYENFSENWMKVPPADKQVGVRANEGVRIMEIAAELMEEPNLRVTYRDVIEGVEKFDCGAFFTDEYLAANPDLKVTLELRIYNPDNEEVNYIVGKAYTFLVKKVDTATEGVEIEGTTDPIEENKVKIEKVTIDQSSITDETVTIDTNVFVEDEAVDVVESVSIPASTITDVNDLGENATLNITFANGEGEDVQVSINKEALEAIKEDLGNQYEGRITLKIEKIDEDERDEHLEDEQQEVVETLTNEAVYKILLETEDGEIYNTAPATGSGRKIEVKLPYVKSSGAGRIVAEHLTDAGEREKVDFEYDEANGIITIKLAHFSEYIIHQEPLPTGNAPSGGLSAGGGTAEKYTVKFETNGGSAIADKKVSEGSKAGAPEKPTKEGYKFVGWYTDKELTIAYDFNSKVSKDITLYAKWEAADEAKDEAGESNSKWFADVKEDAWYYQDVKYAFENGLMNGISEKEFAPNEKLTRAMFVTILYRADGSPAVNKSIPFADIKEDSYYQDAVIWAQQNGIVNGVTETEFAPDRFITREQLAAIMFRYAGYKKYDVTAGEKTDILSYEDGESVSEYAVSAMQYACGSGLLKGKTEATINPLDNTTRAEVAAVIRRFIEGNVQK